MYIEKSALETVTELYKEGFNRSDHFNGESSLYRLVACVRFNVSLSAEEAMLYSHKLKDELYKLSVRPFQLRIYRSFFEIEWLAQGYQVVNSEEQYLGLLLNFANLLDECSIVGMEFYTGFLSEHPGEEIEGVSDLYINYFPVFNQECFGSKDPIEVSF